MEAVAFVSDPSLPIWTSSPHGKFEFYELVGVTPGELAEMRASTTAAVIDRLAATDPLLMTDPSCSRCGRSSARAGCWIAERTVLAASLAVTLVPICVTTPSTSLSKA